MICPEQFRARVGGFLPRSPRQRARIKTDPEIDKYNTTITMTIATNLELGRKTALLLSFLLSWGGNIFQEAHN